MNSESVVLLTHVTNTTKNCASEDKKRVDKSSTSLLAGVKAGHVRLCRVAGNTV